MSQQPSPESNLARTIGLDLFSIGRWQFILLIFIFISAIGVVLVTHNTRQMIDQRENLLLEKDLLDGEWRNLILEENALAEHSRVQRLAMEELEMKRPEPDKEVIIKLP
ncbi:cell division protein FtsL [Vibrio sp. Of7-15]|uniref:cell division protein FtsL n=1 Tax=Vibrio sp. Of7-15 TaxID=2724879 RepID=UPI001EF219AB|nr:cell division protein FtsL [Vibrio sp. Of7-15]MCG7498186.1 cell division protein FtsL [Vibrio sp. Of7-15]